MIHATCAIVNFTLSAGNVYFYVASKSPASLAVAVFCFGCGLTCLASMIKD